MSKAVIVGGGAAGMAAAVFLAEKGHTVHLFEKNEKLGKKIYITGKGRCNFTNACPQEELFDNIIHGRKFYTAHFMGIIISTSSIFLKAWAYVPKQNGETGFSRAPTTRPTSPWLWKSV